ncbi:hypothetical protein C7293_24595 [filamentous cyanobacterium CCT1]|nr:hypothetical protein C7293_24595 [filamentous cyanobacterium CCT1]PSN78099.1 hypothetical protein C8B47_18650 [filamentous cyanobacterium CCP4]
MESKLYLIEKLIMELESFEFKNFSSGLRQSEFETGLRAGKDSPEWSIFKTRLRNVISNISAENSPAMRFISLGIKEHTHGYGIDAFKEVKNNFMKALELTKEILEGEDLYGELKGLQSRSILPALSNKIFIVHGRDQSLKTDTERFLREIGLIPVVLHREVDQGKTIIEKFEQHSDVGYAFILLTPDEISFPSTENHLEDSCRTKKYRARPNVIFEFGYFIGKLGRHRVCCLHKGNVEIPSDIDGLVYKKVDDSIDSQGWAIVKEIKAAGYQINM